MQTEIETLQSDVFDLFENLLAPDLVVNWQEIIALECMGVDYVSLSGTKPGVARGKVLGAITPCYFASMCLFCCQDSAERVRHYLITTMFQSIDFGINIGQGMTRF